MVYLPTCMVNVGICTIHESHGNSTLIFCGKLRIQHIPPAISIELKQVETCQARRFANMKHQMLLTLKRKVKGEPFQARPEKTAVLETTPP